ncbi:tail fiber assembly protein [Pectobacterium parmentieri]|uniref:tail fiber assembly protein n=1 Tax=Pectobacterium parmentieri TaxID=1905730 RepID=UPI0013C49323|nr:tail fiber assembly protein [Pectobacterium parmentieri]MBI0520700.1 tail fiber assembly protein [Pectobacterium parmentieri]
MLLLDAKMVRLRGRSVDSVDEILANETYETGTPPTPVPSREEYIQIATGMRTEIYETATREIVVLQDKVDLNTATEEDSALLKKWKAWRIAINSVNITTAPNIIWPMQPK